MSRYVGMDLGIASAHYAAVLDGAERRGKPFRVEVTREGFEQLLARASDGAEGAVNFVLEPTGLAWVPVAAYMAAAGHRVYLIKPQKTSGLRRVLKPNTKTDGVDADVNARVPQVDPKGVHEMQLPTPEQMTLRRCVNRRERMAQEIADQKRRVHALMIMLNPGLMPALGESAFSQAGRALLRHYADPQTVVKMGRVKLKTLWAKHSRGPVEEPQIERIFQACSTVAELYAELRQNQKLPFDYADMQDELRAELGWMETAESVVQGLEQRIATLYDRWDPDHTLEQIRGIGPVIAPTIEALVGNILRFHNCRQFVSYCGLCPRKKQSGHSDPALPITKSGQRLLKKYLYLAADVARQWDPEFAQYYARRFRQGVHHDHIMVALARKMASRVYALLKRREQARQTGSSAPSVAFVLRDPATGLSVDKKQARELVVQHYSRAAADPARHQRDLARRGKGNPVQGTGVAPKEWPSKDATGKHPVPSVPIAQTESSGNAAVPFPATLPRGGGWTSLGDLVKALLEQGPVENLRKSCEKHSAPTAKVTKKDA